MVYVIRIDSHTNSLPTSVLVPTVIRVVQLEVTSWVSYVIRRKQIVFGPDTIV